jgi:hypothetical protein
VQINWTRIIYCLVVVGALFAGYYAPHPTPAPAPLPPVPPAPSVSYIGAPAKVTASVGRQVVIELTGSAPVIHAKLLDRPTKSNNVPIDLLELDNGHKVVFTSPTAGVFYLRFEATQGTDIIEERTEVDAGDVPPVPPGPTPVPPGPPGPPLPPVPDPFLASLQAAWAADTDPQKASERDILQGMYQTYAGGIPANVVTYGDLLANMVQVEKAILPSMPLVGERKAIGAYLTANLPTDPTKPVDKAITAKVFGTVATNLGQLK